MIKIYTQPNCPNCSILKSKLEDKEIKYENVIDIEVMRRLGIRTVPMIEIDGKLMNYYEGVKWVNAYEK